MHLSASGALSLLCSIALLPLAAPASLRPADNSHSPECITPRPIPDVQGASLRNFGVVLFRAFDMLDVFGPLDSLQLMAHLTQQMNLYLIAETLDPVTTEASSSSMNPFNSSFWPTLTPTNTIHDDLDLDVLLVPGGPGMRAPNLEPLTDYIARMFPKVKLLITVCTGSGLAAKSGVLNGSLATTNKHAWESVVEMGPEVQWVAPARYVIDGKTWSSSGVTASLDLISAFIETYWGAEEASRVNSYIEHVPRSAKDDPFTEYFNITKTEAQPCPVKP